MPEKKATPITVAEHEGITDPPTKRVLLYGWDGTTKRRLSTDASGVLNVGATFSANASQAVVSTSHSSLKAASQIWGVDGTIATVASLANRNALAVITVDSTGAIQSPLVSGSSVSAFQGGAWSVDIGSALPAGTNNIGDVDVLSLPALPAGNNNIGNVDVASIAAGDNNIGNVDVVSMPTVTVQATDLDVRNLVFATDKADVSGSSIIASQAGTWTVQPGNTANTTPWLTTITPGTSGGWSKVSTASLTGTALTVKGSAGTFGGYYVYNPNSSVAYVQVFDATAPTVGTTAPSMIYGIPATAGANLEIANGVNMATAITWAATTAATNSSPVTTNLVATAYYK